MSESGIIYVTENLANRRIYVGLRRAAEERKIS